MWALLSLGSLSLLIIYPTTDFVMKYYLNFSLYAALVYYASSTIVINWLIISLGSCFLRMYLTPGAVVCVHDMLISFLVELVLSFCIYLANPFTCSLHYTLILLMVTDFISQGHLNVPFYILPWDLPRSRVSYITNFWAEFNWCLLCSLRQWAKGEKIILTITPKMLKWIVCLEMYAI